jgi:DNA-binding SARP family transcriptional activator
MESRTTVLVFSAAPTRWKSLAAPPDGAYELVFVHDASSLQRSLADDPHAVFVLDIDSPIALEVFRDMVVHRDGAWVMSPSSDAGSFASTVQALASRSACSSLSGGARASRRRGVLHRSWRYLNDRLSALTHLAESPFRAEEQHGDGASAPVATASLTPPDSQRSPLRRPVWSEQPERSAVFAEASILDGALLGSFRVSLNGQLYDRWPSRKGKNLLAFLLYHHDRPCFRDTLIETFWPDVSFESAKNSLHVALHGIRKQLCPSFTDEKLLLCENERYFFHPDIELRLDHEDFLKAYQTGRRVEQQSSLPQAVASYERATSLYRGDLLEGDVQEEWSCSERAMLRERYLVALERLSHHYAVTGQFATAVALCDAILQRDNCREDVHRRLMRCYYQSGKRCEAIKQFQRCAESLLKELDVAPSKATLELIDRIRKESVGDEPMA